MDVSKVPIAEISTDIYSIFLKITANHNRLK